MSSISIELKSDLCVATGTGYSSFVDTDVSYDAFGLPYIPARRLKGCLREAGEYIGVDKVTLDRLFGTRGQDKPGTLMISNGHLVEADALRQYLDQQKAQGHPILPQTVLNLFTHIRASTSVDPDTGVAKDETLRYTRVVNQKHPGGGKQNLIFVFECEDDGNPDTQKELKSICKALRNIGANRTRGLGAVKCTYDSGVQNDTGANQDAPDTGDGTNKQLSLHLKLLDPLLITALSGDDCCNYVSGAAVLGAMASLYLKQFRQPDALFEKLFLCGKVTYSNLYISDAEGTECIPAPYFIRKLKSSDSHVDGQTLTFYDDKSRLIKGRMPEGTDESVLKQIERLAQPKPMRGKMLSRPAFDNQTITECKVKTERAYHHSVHNTDRSMIWRQTDPQDDDPKNSLANDASMYVHTCIEAGQYLFGTIEGPENLLQILAKLLEKWPLRLGMSRSAQYSRCVLAKEKPTISDLPQTKAIPISAGGKLVIALESDLIPETQDSMIESIVKDVISTDIQHDDIQMDQTAMDYHMIHGYHAKRNLRNTPVRAAMMGSVITVKLEQAHTFNADFLRVGRRKAEGFGAVRLYDADKLKGFKTAKTAGTMPAQDQTDVDISWFTKALQAANPSDAIQLGREIYATVKGCFNDRSITSSLIGRLMLMTEEAVSMEDMKGRIASIKKKRKKRYAKKSLPPYVTSLCRRTTPRSGRTAGWRFFALPGMI